MVAGWQPIYGRTWSTSSTNPGFQMSPQGAKSQVITDPARRAAGKQTTPENIAAVRHAFGLDEPLYVRYGRFAKGLIPWPGLFLNEDVYYSYTNFVR